MKELRTHRNFALFFLVMSIVLTLFLSYNIFLPDTFVNKITGSVSLESGYDFVYNETEIIDSTSDNISIPEVNLTAPDIEEPIENIFTTIETNDFNILAAPDQGIPILNSTFGTNYTSENLTCYNQSTTDLDGDPVKNIYNWYKNNVSLMILNMPFENNTINVSNSTKDYTRYENNGTVHNATWNATGGYDGRGAYEFNGTNSYIDLGNDASVLPPDAWTVMGWVKIQNTTTQAFFCFANYYSPCVHLEWSARGMIYLDDNNLRYFNTGYSTLKDNKWHHVAFSINGSGQYDIHSGAMYIDGVSIAAGTTLNTSAQDAKVNAYVGGVPSYPYAVNGTIDEVKLYNRTLTAEQIKAIYENQTNTIVSQETTKGENWSCSITPNDGTVDGPTNMSNSLTVLDVLDVTTPVFNQTTYYTNNNILASTIYSHPTGGSGTIFWQWYVNSTSVYNQTNKSVSDGSTVDSILSSGNFSLNDLVNVTVFANGTINSTLRWSSTIIINSPPTQNIPVLNSTFGTNYSNENLTCYNQSTTDPEGDSVKNIYNWYRNNVSIMVLNMPFEKNTVNVSQTTKDYTQFENNGTVHNATWNATGGYDGRGAYEIDGIDGYIDLGSDSSVLPDAWTVVGWVKIKTKTLQTFFCFRNYYTPCLFLEWGGYPVMYLNSGNYQRFDASGYTNLIDGNWHHVAFSINGSGQNDIDSAAMYVDGISIAKASTTKTTAQKAKTNAYIGDVPYGAYALNGTIDEMRLYNVSLSAEQILALYNNKTNVIVSPEIIRGEEWQCSITPNDGYADGINKTSSSLSILNAPPDQPGLNTPANGAINQYPTVNLNINVTDADGDLMNITFINYTNNVTIGTSLNIPSGSSVNSIWSGLAGGTTYYWYVNITDGTDITTSSVWNFTVIECPCTNCSDCTDKINNPNCSSIYLIQNIDTTTTCINNPANFSNKTFNCLGYMINGSNNGDFGIYLLNKKNNSIINCIIKSFKYGIYLNASSNISINYSRIENNSIFGIVLENSKDNNIFNNLFNNTFNFNFSGAKLLNYWNTTNHIGSRIYSNGINIGGNYWTNASGDGFSDTCDDDNRDKFCDDEYNLTNNGNNTDYLPLSGVCNLNGICDSWRNENIINCPEDCPVPICDNDDNCEGIENQENCPNDCWGYPVSPEFSTIIHDIWNNRKQYFLNRIIDSFVVDNNSQQLYNIQSWTNPLLDYVDKAQDYALLDELAEVYLTAYDYLDFKYNFTTRCFGGATRTLDSPSWMWRGHSSGYSETFLYSSQFLYLLSRAINIISGLDAADRTSNMNNLVSNYTSIILIDHYYRWIFSNQDFFCGLAGCTFNASDHYHYLQNLYNHNFGNAYSYCKVILDADMWVMAGVVEMLAANNNNPTLVPINDIFKNQLLNYTNLSSALLLNRVNQSNLTNFNGTAVYGRNVDPGSWDDFYTYYYSNYTNKWIFPTPPHQPAKNVGWDISHANRFARVFNTFYHNKDVTTQSFPNESVMEQLANQLIYGVFKKNFEKPLFTNYMDGTEGWYAVNYEGRAGYGSAPYDLTRTIIRGARGVWYPYNSDVLDVMNSLWRMINSVYIKDYSNKGNDGMANNPTWNQSDVFNQTGSYIFDGVDDYINVGTDSSVLPDAWTVMGWVKITPTTTLEQFFCFANNYIPCVHLDWVGRPMMYLNSGNYQYFDAASYNNLTDGNWHHIAFSINGSGQTDINSAAMYVDGISIPTSGVAAQTTAQATKTNAYLGDTPSRDFPFNGTIDEFYLYNYSLSATEINTTYQRGLQNLTSNITNNLAVYYPMNDTPNQNVVDFANEYYGGSSYVNYNRTDPELEFGKADSLHLLQFLPSLATDKFCGNDVCDSGETTANCPEDCPGEDDGRISGGGGSAAASATESVQSLSMTAQTQTFSLTRQQSVSFSIANQKHTLTVVSMTSDTVTINVQSELQKFVLKQYDKKLIDVNRDGKDDLEVDVLYISGKRVQLRLTKLKQTDLKKEIIEELKKENQYNQILKEKAGLMKELEKSTDVGRAFIFDFLDDVNWTAVFTGITTLALIFFIILIIKFKPKRRKVNKDYVYTRGLKKEMREIDSKWSEKKKLDDYEKIHSIYKKKK